MAEWVHPGSGNDHAIWFRGSFRNLCGTSIPGDAQFAHHAWQSEFLMFPQAGLRPIMARSRRFATDAWTGKENSTLLAARYVRQRPGRPLEGGHPAFHIVESTASSTPFARSRRRVCRSLTCWSWGGVKFEVAGVNHVPSGVVMASRPDCIMLWRQMNEFYTRRSTWNGALGSSPARRRFAVRVRFSFECASAAEGRA